MSNELDYKNIKKLNIKHLNASKTYSFIFMVFFTFIIIISPVDFLEWLGYNSITNERSLVITLVLLFGSIATWLTSTIALANVKE
ncbi:hypothetical protein V1503_02965 [Bacillus sp. SCS-151]|uniref:hypothetical protein n=1 Tax=Nanhaiella sioensis TaxID=3115293 RepID=UPI00397ACCB0